MKSFQSLSFEIIRICFELVLGGRFARTRSSGPGCAPLHILTPLEKDVKN